MKEFYEDKAIQTKDEDLYGRNRLVENIAKIIDGKTKKEHGSFTIGLYGSWGEGKTSVLNLLKEKFNGIENVYQCSFNPWMLSDQESIMQEFFVVLQHSLNIDNVQQVVDKIKRYGSLISYVVRGFGHLLDATVLPGASIVTTSTANQIDKVHDLLSDRKPLKEQKEEINTALKTSNAHIIVYIDDLDRLDKDEMRIVFRLIRQVADFDNVIYVIAMDHDMVTRSLNAFYEGEGNANAGQAFLEKINSNRLLISLVGQLGGVTANEVMGWFRSDFDAMSSSLDDSFGSYTKHALVENDAMAIEIKDFIRKFQLGFNDLSARKIDFDQLQFPAGIPAEILAQIKSKPIIELNTRHAVYDENGIVKYEKLVPLDDYESEGTIKLVHMSGVLARALYYGTTIAIDEFDARIHPTICQRIVDIFNSSETNPRGAQLLVTTHDTNLLSNKIFRRDQICFVKQDECASTIVYPLLDIMMPNGQAPRSDSNYERNYLLGAYDNIPTKYSANRDGI